MSVKIKKVYASIATLALFAMLLGETPLEAALFGTSRKNNTPVLRVEKNNEALVKLFDLNDKKEGNTSDPLTFAQRHYELGATKLQTTCRAISSFYNDPVARDLLQKIFTIDTQYFKEDIKNSATAIKKISELNFAINSGLQELSQVITAPGSNTLDSLERVVEKNKAINRNLVQITKNYIKASEKSIQIARAGYETFELIPSLSMAPVDMFVQSSRLLMSSTQSNAEAFKGLLLNILSGTEQITLGLDGISKNVRETLRFSDHFAIKQFPLVNLPAPSREKIFIQLNSMANFVKGSENTIAIAESQIRNQAQQFTHLVGNFVDKSAESMKYNKATNMPLEQISTYARNQVNGLYLRVKEEVLALRREMANQALGLAKTPEVVVETKESYAIRQTKALSKDKLPLFLLGGTERADEAAFARPNTNLDKSSFVETSVQQQPQDFTDFIKLNPTQQSFNQPSSFVQTAVDNNSEKANEFFESKDFAFDDESFGASEMSIITQELGSNFFFDEKDSEDGKDLIISTSEDMPDFGANIPSSADQTRDYDSFSMLDSGLDPELELLDF
jgi:hypothetical protein